MQIWVLIFSSHEIFVNNLASRILTFLICWKGMIIVSTSKSQDIEYERPTVKQSLFFLGTFVYVVPYAWSLSPSSGSFHSSLPYFIQVLVIEHLTGREPISLFYFLPLSYLFSFCTWIIIPYIYLPLSLKIICLTCYYHIVGTQKILQQIFIKWLNVLIYLT